MADLYGVPTWRCPNACDPLSSLPVRMSYLTGIKVNDALDNMKHLSLKMLKKTLGDVLLHLLVETAKQGNKTSPNFF